LILPPEFESKIGQNNPENRRKQNGATTSDEIFSFADILQIHILGNEIGIHHVKYETFTCPISCTFQRHYR
jgi:hypothetical protein